MISKRALSSKIAIFSLFVLAVLLGDLKFKQWQNQREIEKQKQSLEAQADAQQKKNNELSQSLQYLNSASFKERVARDQLGLKKQDEQVYSFLAGPVGESAQGQNRDKAGNLKKWWDYFFGTQ